MDNITKIKLINSLIDAVTHFYELKQKGVVDGQNHIKGFCEGMAYTLVEISVIDKDEAKRILKGLGKHREIDEAVVETNIETKEKNVDLSDLEVPTYMRKKSESNPDDSLI